RLLSVLIILEDPDLSFQQRLFQGILKILPHSDLLDPPHHALPPPPKPPPQPHPNATTTSIPSPYPSTSPRHPHHLHSNRYAPPSPPRHHQEGASVCCLAAARAAFGIYNTKQSTFGFIYRKGCVRFCLQRKAGSENRPPRLNKENYRPWSSRLLRYAKSRPNGKLIHNSIINVPYVRRMIPEPGDINREVPVNETFHVQTDDELTEKELKQTEADDQVIQTILLGLPEDIYATVDSCETDQEIWLRVQQMMKGSDIGIQEKKANLFNE
nr:hypothetical protein [Tanacetum cinerariifolium]